MCILSSIHNMHICDYTVSAANFFSPLECLHKPYKKPTIAVTSIITAVIVTENIIRYIITIIIILLLLYKRETSNYKIHFCFSAKVLAV